MSLDSESYKVEVIYFINPHLIWIEVCDTVNKHDFIFEQVGVYGVLPLETTLDIEDEEIKIRKCDEWIMAANTVMKNFFCGCTDIWFSPTFIDKRTSIFDDNIHKYGEFIVKQKNGEYKKLSELLIKSDVAHYDAAEFHNQLHSGNFKTKLSPKTTQEVVKEIKNYYIKSNNKQTNLKKSIEKQTSTFHMGQGLEEDLTALTASNLEKHNNAMLNKILEDKKKDFELCKDIDDESLGRGFVKTNKKSYDDTVQPNITSTDQKLKSSEFNHRKTCDNIKRFLVANAKIKDAIPIITNEDLKINNEESKGSLLSKKLNIINRLEQIKLKKVRDEQKSDVDISMENKIKKSGRCEEPINQESQWSNNVIERQVKASSKIRHRNRTRQEDSNSNQVIFGPPGFNPQHLKTQKVEVNEILNQVINIEDDSFLKNNTICDDSELNLDVNKQKEFSDFCDKVKSASPKKEAKFDYNLEDRINNGNKVVKSESSDKRAAMSLLLKKKLRAYDNLSAHNSTFSSSDTSNKDSSSHSDKELDENIYNVVKVIDENYKVVPTIKNRLHSNDSLPVTKLKNNVNPFKNIDPNISVFVDKLVSPILMVHTKNNNRIQPVFDMRDVFFNSHIHIVLRNMSIHRPMMLQTISWNTILRGYSLFMVSPPQSGKTFGYLPAVCRLVSDVSCNGSAGPVCIIVCATAKSVAFVEELAKMFLGLEDRVLACYAGVDDLYITSTLLNGCDILISTPSSLIRLMQLNEYGVDLRRLSLFVLDDCERLASIYMDELKFFLFKIREALKVRANNELKIQYILASRVWCDFMGPLAKKAPDTVISISAFQECLLYSKSNTSVSFVKIENKLDAVFEFLKEIDSSKKTVIVCKSDDEVQLLETSLKRSEHTVFSCNNEMNVHDLFNLSVSWSDYKAPLAGPILICCDGNLTHMNITDANNLIHFSLPQLFSMFCKRFCVLNDNYPSIFKTDNENVKIKILLDGSNVEQLPKIMNFIKRCTNSIPEFLHELSDNIAKEKEIVKAKNIVPICNNLLIFGYCPDLYNCQERHAISEEYDTPKEWMPETGIITFRILHYHTAILYSARLLTSTVNGVTTKYPQTYSSLSMKMGMYYSKESNKRLHGIPKIGDVCAVLIKTNFYARCQVVKILNEYRSGNPNSVLVNLIDEDKYEISRDIYLYYLPDEFKDIETYVALVRLANVIPKDKDITFSGLASDQLKKISDNDDIYIKGHVSLALGNCIFVDTLEACQELTSLNETVVKHNLKKELLDNHAQLNPDHIHTIEKLCSESGLILKNEIKVTEAQDPVKNLSKGTWAYLENDISTVFLAAAKTPDQFFIRLTKFESCMKFLLQDIKKYTDAYNFAEKLNVKEGDLVLAECPEDSMYERARIDCLNGDETKCFFVDQGDWKVISLKKLIPITEKFIDQLPFQAIECRLIGILPPGEEWSDFSKNWFLDNCSEDKNGDLKYMYIKHYTKETAEFTDGYKYGVALIDTNTDTDIAINQVMIDLNLARVNYDEEEYLNKLLADLEESNKQLIQEEVSSVEDDWEKISQVMEDTSIGNTVQLMTPDSGLNDQLIRSVPLDSNEENFEKWDVNMDKEVMSTLIPGFRTTTNTDSPIIKEDDNPNKEHEKLKQIVCYRSKQSPIQELDSDDLSSSETSHICNALPEKKTQVDQKRRPQLLWRQHKNIVTIKIQLIAVENYNIEIEDRTIKFSANVNDVEYEFDIELYGVVDKNKCSHFKTGLYIMVKLVQVLQAKWLSLTKRYDTKHFISYDAESIDTASEDEEVDKNTLKKIVETLRDNETDSDDDEFFDDLSFTYKKD